MFMLLLFLVTFVTCDFDRINFTIEDNVYTYPPRNFGPGIFNFTGYLGLFGCNKHSKMVLSNVSVACLCHNEGPKEQPKLLQLNTQIITKSAAQSILVLTNHAPGEWRWTSSNMTIDLAGNESSRASKIFTYWFTLDSKCKGCNGPQDKDHGVEYVFRACSQNATLTGAVYYANKTAVPVKHLQPATPLRIDLDFSIESVALAPFCADISCSITVTPGGGKLHSGNITRPFEIKAK